MVDKKYVIVPAVVVAIVAAVAGIYLSSGVSNEDMANNAEELELGSSNVQQKENQPESFMDLFSKGSPVLGSADAPITIVEFGDYQCTNCNRYFHNTEHQVLQNYVETGKAKVIFVDFAFIGQDSVTAAQAAHCANDQGKYWEYHDEVYSNWSGENTGWASATNLKKFASSVSLDQDQFNKCLDSNRYAQQVKDNFGVGHQFGVTGTPTFLIIDSAGKAVKVVGAQPYSVLAQVLDSKL